MEKIGFIGVGLMGHGMAWNLVTKKYPLVFKAHRRRDHLADLLAAGAVEVDTLRELSARSDIVFICVTGSPQVEANVYGTEGLLAHARKGQLVVDCSTSEPQSTARIRADFAERGVEFVDAPLARTPKEAEEGRLNTMVGANFATFERLQPVMKAFCENVIHVGPPGHGHVIKLINNFLAMAIAASTAEAFAAAARAGVSLKKLFEVVSAGGVNSGVFQMLAGGAVEGDLARMKFTIGNGRKDMRYYTHMTEELGTPSHLGEAVHQALVQAGALGLSDKFMPALIEAQERLNDTQIVPR
ncbi:MAG TPA: NAD(P)-dependent oxidoreductase [Burkholderiaceae bacterium]|nr:NAD(P)-dependent oxidoreductase [Burkholderiaceae bacterium]